MWFHANHLTSTRLMTDAGGAKVAHYDYAIFGEKTHESGSASAKNKKGFTSHEHDDELGLIYMKARYYDPVLGRFISPDTIIPEPGNPQSWNRYAYVLNNPFNNTDPTGHDTFRQNRELQALNFDKNSEPVEHGVSHTFVYTTKPDGSLDHTYSWGNTYDKNGNGEWAPDKKADTDAAKTAIEQREAYESAPGWKKPFLADNFGKRVGGSELDPQVEQEFQKRENDPNHPSKHGWKPQANCKHEADNLLKDAKSGLKEAESKKNSSAPPASSSDAKTPDKATEKKD